MPISKQQVLDIFRQLHWLKSLDESEIDDFVSKFSYQRFNQGDVIYNQGDQADGFFVILSGRVSLTRSVAGEEKTVAKMVAGDYFGEEEVLRPGVRIASAHALDLVEVIWLDQTGITSIMVANKDIKADLSAAAESRRMARKVQFKWLGSDEIVHLVARKHDVLLWTGLSVPLALAILSTPLFYLSYRTQISTPAIIGGVVLFIAILWAIWKALDWGNDYYIVTDKRVVWLERVIGLYDSRQEAPLNTVLAVSVASDFLGRTLGYGNVIVRTYTGQIVMRNVGNPSNMAALVEGHWKRSRRMAKEEETEIIRQTLRQKLGAQPEDESMLAELPAEEIPMEFKPGFIQVFLTNFLRMRHEEGNMITYRKHWYLLLKRIWKPTLLLVLLGLLTIGRLTGWTEFLSIETTLLFALVIGMLGSGWWLYEYVDWRNDLFLLTPEHIVDIYRKPLGQEEKKSAPLENILSLSHNRTGIIGLIFNFGTVTAMVGRTPFTFEGVHNPAQIQQDIYEKMNERILKAQATESAMERERMAEWIIAYHEQRNKTQGDGEHTDTDEIIE